MSVRIMVTGRCGAADLDKIDVSSDERTAEFPLLNAAGKWGFNIRQVTRQALAHGIFPTTTAFDLLTLAIHVQMADLRISRALWSTDGWTREIRLVVPVVEPRRWHDRAPLLDRMLSFLTGDVWTVQFRQRPRVPPYTPRVTRTDEREFDGVCLYSGGLDSLVGVIDACAAGKRPLLASCGGTGGVGKPQQAVFGELRRRFSALNLGRVTWGVRPPRLGDGPGAEPTTRGRSFSFFALAAFLASGMDGNTTIRVPENGLIALNVPLDPLRIGAPSTRTTHPFYMRCWNDLLRGVGMTVTLENPYAHKTKGEMVQRCSDQAALTATLPLSMSCSSPSKARFTAGNPAQKHCGYCVPCLIRRGAVAAGFAAADPTDYDQHDLSAIEDEPKGLQVRAFRFACATLPRSDFALRMHIQKSGPLGQEGSSERKALAAMYARGVREVGAILP